MAGRKVTINGPLDMARLSGRTRFAQRWVVRNGQLNAAGDSVWNSVKVTSQGSYSAYYQTRLSNVTNVANIQVIHVPTHCFLCLLYHAICDTWVIWISFECQPL